MIHRPGFRLSLSCKLPKLVWSPTLALLLMALSVVIPSTAQADETVSVPGNHPWVDTGISVDYGNSMSFSASGLVNIYGGRADSYKTPQGSRDCTTAPDKYGGQWLLMGAPCWSLIGRVGSGPAFEIGTGAIWAAPNGGTIYLSVDDESLASFNDNSGQWTVVISIGSGGR